MNKKKGNKLIVIISVICIIALIATYFLISNNKVHSELSNSNKTETVNTQTVNKNSQNTETTFKLSVNAIKSQLTLYIAQKMASSNVIFDETKINASAWDGNNDKIKGTIKEYITNMTTVSGKKFAIKSGELVYVGSDKNEIQWFIDINKK